MRVLLDENIPIELASLLEGREVDTVVGLGWTGITNGELLKRMRGTFDVLVTMDQNLPHQQNLPVQPFAVVLLEAPSSKLVHLRLLVPAMLAALDDVQPGELRRVGA